MEQNIAYLKIKSHDDYLKVVEQYKDYKAGTYESMTLKEKMEFLDGIHTDKVVYQMQYESSVLLQATSYANITLQQLVAFLSLHCFYGLLQMED